MEETKRIRRYAYRTVTVIALFALAVAGLTVSVANDMYAFVKSAREVTLTVDAPMALEELSERLEREGIVANPTVFSLYVKAKGRGERMESFSGEVTLRSDMSYREILLAFAVG